MVNKITTIRPAFGLWTALFFFLLPGTIQRMAAQIHIETIILPPYPTQLDYYTDDLSQLLLMIRNTSVTSAYAYRLEADIIGPGGISANVRYLSTIGVIQPGEIQNFNGAQLRELGMSSDGIAQTDNLTEEQRIAIAVQHALPEGDYTICFKAFNELGDLISDPSSGCTDFQIQYIDRPEMIVPAMDEIVYPVVTPAWAHDRSVLTPEQNSRLTYRMTIGDATVDHIDQNVEGIYDMNTSTMRRFETQINVLPLMQGVDFDFTPGHQYVVWVTAFDPEGEMMFRDQGNSNVIFFTYDSEDDLEDEESSPYSCVEENPGMPGDCLSPEAEIYFPSQDDTLPFRQLPFILKYNPYCADYRQLDYSFQLSEMPSGIQLCNRTNRLNWPPGGPLQYLLDQGYSNANSDEARLFMVNDNAQTPLLNRSTGYRAEVTSDMTMRDGAVHHDLLTNAFVSGMPVPGLGLPMHRDTLPPGDIDFSWDNGALPWNSFPDVFHLLRLEGSSGHIEDVTYYGEVDERWVLQIASSTGFERANMVSGFSEAVAGMDFTSVEDLMATVYLVNHKSIPILEPGKYYWRVVWLKDPDALVPPDFFFTSTDLYHPSGIAEFTILESAETDEPEEEEEPSTCSSPCIFPDVASTTPVADLPEGSTFTMAGFTVEAREVHGAGSTFSGEGYIRIPFLNNIKLRVQFNGIQINSSRQAFRGNVTPVSDDALPFSEAITPLGRIVSMTQTEAEALDAAIEAGGKLISLLTPGAETALPIGIDKEIEGTHIVIGVVGLVLAPDSARMQAIVNIDLPNMEIIEGFISLGADICVTTQGFANDVKLYLPQDQVFDLGGGNEFVIAGAEASRPANQVTSVEWDCEGFRALNITGIHRFTRDWMLPEDATGHVRSEGKVEARFTGRFTRGANIMINIDMDPFQLPGVEGWGFTVANNAWIDLSDLENPERLMASLPRDYVHPSLSDRLMQNTWKGFFLEEISVHTPEHLQGPDGHPVTFAIRNIFIDQTGLTFSARAENILRWDGSGDMAGWKASLDTFFIDILQNNFRQAGFNGKLGIPIAEETEYMKYQAALQHTDGDFAFVLSVRPAEAIHIPISMAQATILPTTYVRAVIADSSFIEANLSATLTLGNGELPEGTSMPASLSMPGIRIENLRINSSIGFDTTDFSYSLTGLGGMGGGGGTGPSGGHGHYVEDEAVFFTTTGDSESTLSGFPIGLDHFSFSNEGIIIQPRLTLSGSEGGFSAAAKILLNTDMELVPSQRFNLTGVTLQRIDLDVEASDITLKGYLEFYKDATVEGVKGGITLGINMGQRIGVDINADFGTYKTAAATTFNTSQWYSYFYVDGTVFLSSGIQIFSGISLYGLGGGFYHHMQMTSALPSGSEVAAVSAPRRIYAPDFNTDLGLRFKVILGSNGDEGKAYNLDIGLEATFSFAHGLTRLEITGSFRVMTDGITMATIGREDNSPVAGYVRLTLNMPPMAPATFSGLFFVKLKVPATSTPLLAGIGAVPNVPEGWTPNHALVWASFYVGPDKWYFNMGTPTNRGGMRLQIGGKEVARITGYMMIGHDIPVVMPNPDEEFLNIFKNASGGDVHSAYGDPETMTEGQPRQTVPVGEGVAFGVAMALNLDVEFFPFYFDLKTVMGCDINVTRADSGERECFGSDIEPGIDGWYGTGQFYAGIEGAFGIRINLFVEQITVPILEASAALILQGGLPNPEWVAGRGSFYYNVCSGLAEGTCDFAIQAGTVCIPVVAGNPFGEMTLLQDLTPDEGATVEVYSDAAAAFSMEMNRVYEIEQMVSATVPPVIRRFEPYMHSFEIKLDGRGAPLIGTGEWTDRSHVYHFTPQRMLNGNSNYTVRVEARIRENGSDLRVRGSVYSEFLLHHFRTGPMPDRIVENMISFTYPYIHQQHFLKNETRAGEGYIVLRQEFPELSRPGDVSDVDVSFHARFTSQDNELIAVPAIIERDRIIRFDVRQLQPDKIYCLQIIRRDQPRGVISMGGNTNLGAMTGGPVGAGYLPAGGPMQVHNLHAVLGLSTVTSNQFQRIQLPNGRVRQYEKELFNYFFKTSRYLDFREKLEAERNSWEVQKITFGVDIIKVENDFEESLEWVDLQSFKVVPTPSAKLFDKRVGFSLREPPNAEFDAIPEGSLTPNQYLLSTISPRIVVPYLQMVQIRQGVITGIQRNWGVNASSSIPLFPLYEGYGPYQDQLYFTSSTPYMRALDEATINSAFTVNPAGSSYAFPVGSSVPLLPVGFSLGYASPTSVTYGLHLAGLSQHRRMQQDMRQYAYRTVTFPVGVGQVTSTLYELMSVSDQNLVTRVIARDPVGSTRPSKGPHTFGFYYKYPLPDGSNAVNQIIPFTFRY